MNCTSCNKKINGKTYPDGLCQGCYRYFKSGGTINPLPQKGVIEKDYRGYIVCHICGKAYKRLGSHIKESHDMTIAEYKEDFGLCNRTKTTETNYSKHMSELAIKYEMPQRLLVVGMATRIKKGQKHMRLGKKIRLQETIDKRNRKAVKVC